MYEAGNSSARPNVVPYTTVINACAYAVGDEAEKENAMQIATATFNELCASEYGEPNDVTYSDYLVAIRKLLPSDDEEKAKTIASVFQKCCKEGKVSDFVLRRLENASTGQQLSELYQSVGFDGVSRVPVEWRRNVVEQRPINIKRGQQRQR